MLLSTTLLITIGLIGLFYILKWLKVAIANYIELSKLSGPPEANILVGNMNFFQGPPEVVFRRYLEANKKFYPIFKLHGLHKIAVNILTPEDCELIMSNPAHNPKAYIYGLLHGWLQDGLLTSKGQKWQTRRKILTPAFHFSILQQFIQVFNEEADELVEVLKKEWQNSYVNVTSHVTQFTLKTIAHTAMGTKLKFETKKEIKYKDAVHDMGKIFLYRLSHPWFIVDFLNMFSPFFLQERRELKTLHTFTKEVIQEREKNFTDIELPAETDDVYKGKKRLAMLDLLLNAKRKDKIIDDRGIQEEVDTFMFEGHDTTAAAISFVLMLIACHKETQENIVEEMHQVLGDLKKKPNYTDLQNLKYVERCIKESLRLYPSVFFIGRTLGEDLLTHSRLLLPEGATVMLHIYAIHHNPDIYPDPEKFDPDRFLPENTKNRHPFAYIPFSAGPRNCIGQRFAILELKAAICAVLANFVLEPVDTPDSITLIADVILRTKEDIKIRFVPRT